MCTSTAYEGCPTPDICLTWTYAICFGWVSSLNQCIITWFVSMHWPRIEAEFKIMDQCMQQKQIEDGFKCPSTAYEDCPTPDICLTWMYDSFWVGFKPELVHNNMVSGQAVTQGWSRIQRTWPMPVVPMEWWWIHLPIHFMWWLSIPDICWTWMCMIHFGKTKRFVAVQCHGIETDFQNLGQCLQCQLSDDGSICPSTAYEDCPTPDTCLTLMYDSFWMRLKLESVNNNMFCGQSVTRDLSRIQRSWAMPVVPMEWWWIHMPIHCIWWLSIPDICQT